MCFVGLDFLPQQLSIADTVDVSRIRGDISLVVNTRDVADESIAKRKQEMANISGAFAGSKFFNKVQQVTECVAAFRHHGVVTSAHPERYSLVTALREAATMLRT
jgi:hypothetical protein